MKMAFAIISLIFLQLAAAAQAQELRLSLEMKATTIDKILKIIELKTNCHFVYSTDLFPSHQLVNLSVKEKTIPEILAIILKNTGFTFKRQDDLIILSGSVSSTAQRQTTGRVIAATTSEPIAGATVTIDKTNLSTATDENGEFIIMVPENAEALVYSSIGFITQRISLKSGNKGPVIMKEVAGNLNEIVVVGYGARRKKDITGAVSSIGPAEIEKSHSISPELAMQGQMAGVSVISGGGDPSARPTIRIRGVSSFNYADPLYVIDGIPIAEGGAGANVDNVNDPTRRSPVNLYTIIDPNDIESITVLKDAAASAIYGVRAANGVILITMKAGKKGKPRVDVDANSGTQKVPKVYKVLNTPQFVGFYKHEYDANPDIASGMAVPIGQAQNFGPVWDPLSTQYLGNSPSYDWQHALINTGTSLKNFNIRTSGGGDNALYNFSAGYAYNDGPIIGVNTERYSISTNVSSRISKYVEAGVKLRVIQEKINEGSGGDLSVYKAPPWQPILDPANAYGYAPLYALNAPITPSGFSYSHLWGPQYVPIDNYLGAMRTSSNVFYNQSAIGTGFIQVEPFSGLKFKGTLSAQQYTVSNNQYAAFDNWQWLETPVNPYEGISQPVAGSRPNSLSISNSTTTNVVKAINVQYGHSFNGHNIDLMADASEQEYYWKTNSLSSHIYSNDPSLRYFNSIGAEQASSLLNGHYVLLGYLGRASYNFENRYYAEMVVRRDGSSRFAPGHQFGLFPSASAGWRISREKFMESLRFVNDLKLRGSYGILGNEQTTGGWQYLTLANANPPSYNLGTGAQSNNTGIAFGNFANNSLSWEKLHSANIGVDASLFKNSLSLTADYYYKITKGIIQRVKLAPSAGFEVPVNLNIADVLNRGVEFQAAYNVVLGPIALALSANLTTVHNEVLALAGGNALRTSGQPATGTDPNLQIGLPVNFIYGYKVGGIFQSQAEVDKYAAVVQDKIATRQVPGDIWFRDLYGPTAPGTTLQNPVRDNVVDAADQTYLGKTIPGYYYGFSIAANYKNADISLFFQGVGDLQKYNFLRADGESMSGYGRNQLVSVLEAWTPARHSATMPRAAYNDPGGNTRPSDRFVENASYLRFQNLTLGYDLPKKWLQPTKAIRTIHVFLTGVNLFTLTRYSGLDPENDVNPTTRQYLAGVKASF